jgi:hypothetical protein
MIDRPPVRWTARTLTLGTVFSALCLVAAFALTLADADGLAATLSTIGVMALLITPAAGLVVTWAELRRHQPSAAILALVVLGVLGMAVAVALLTRA